MALKDHYAGLLRGLPSGLARAAAKKSWENRDLPNWRDRVGDLLEGKQIFVKDLRGLTRSVSRLDAKEFKHAASNFLIREFAVSADGLYDRKIEFVAAGNVYYTRRE